MLYDFIHAYICRGNRKESFLFDFLEVETDSYFVCMWNLGKKSVVIAFSSS